MKKAMIVVAALAALGLIGFQVYRKVFSKAPEAGRQMRRGAVAVETAPVQKGAIRDVGTFTGSLAARSHVVIAPKVAGRLEKLMVSIGDRVKCGALIATLDAEEYDQQVRQAQAELDVAKANEEEARISLDRARRDFERVAALHRKEIASDAERDAADALFRAEGAKVKVAQAQVLQKEAALKSAQVRLSYTRITASCDDGGSAERLVGERFADQGAMLRANDPIVSLLDISSLTAVINIIERDYTKVQPGQAVAIRSDAFPNRTFEGRVERIAPVLKEGTRQARVEIAVPNADAALKPGMFVRAQIEFARHENATIIPLAALVRRAGAQGVFLADLAEKKAWFRKVTLGVTNEGMAEVVNGADLTGSVVTLGQHLLDDGTAIIPAGAGAAPEPAKASKDKQKSS